MSYLDATHDHFKIRNVSFSCPLWIPEENCNHETADSSHIVAQWCNRQDTISQTPLLGIPSVPIVVNDKRVHRHSNQAYQDKADPQCHVNMWGYYCGGMIDKAGLNNKLNSKVNLLCHFFGVLWCMWKQSSYSLRCDGWILLHDRRNIPSEWSFLHNWPSIVIFYFF